MRKLVLLAVLSVLCVGWLLADYPGAQQCDLKVIPVRVSSVAISSLVKARGSAATLTDGIDLKITEAHSVGVTFVSTQTVSCTITVLGSWDGVTYGTLYKDTGSAYSAVTPITLTAAGTGTYALSLPAVPIVRLSLGSDATYPVTYTAVKFMRF